MKKELKYFLLGVVATFAGSVFAQTWSVFSGIRVTTTGSEATPSYSWQSDQDMGLTRLGADQLNVGVLGSTTGIPYLFLDGSINNFSGEADNFDFFVDDGDFRLTFANAGSFITNELITNTVIDTVPAYQANSPNGIMQFIPSELGGSRARINIWDETSTRVPLTLDAEQVTFHLGAAGGADSVLSVSGFTNNGWNRVSDGTVGTPSYSFANDTNTGLYSSAADTIGFTTAGAQRMTLSSTLSTFNTALAFNGTVTTDNTTADEVGYKGIPQNIQAGNYTLVLTDAATHIYHASGAGAGDTYTIPANGSVAYPVGTVVTFINDDSNSISIAITTDTMTLAGTTTTGTRTLAENGVATAVKVTSTSWIINGTGITAVFEPLNPLNDAYYDQRAAA